nr:MAG TPA: hypothetical protein [Caudoviricetes sp.]
MDYNFFLFSVTFFSFFSILYMRQAAANRPGHARSKIHPVSK